jgi:putative transposase
VGEWDGYVRGHGDDQDLETMRRHERTGRPLGSQDFVRLIEDTVGRMLRPRKPGPKVSQMVGN